MIDSYPITTRISSFNTLNLNHRNDYLLSYHKTVPLDKDIIKQRSQMILHTSKISKDSPQWFKGDTYKYYNKNEYKKLYEVPFSKRKDSSISSSTIQLDNGINQKIFYYGVGDKSLPVRRRNLRKLKADLTPKIGSTQKRQFSLPQIQIKIGKELYINTFRPT